MVTGHQNHSMDNSTYTQMYHAILKGIPLEVWAKLEEMQVGGTLTLLCYCADENHDGGRKFCHTNLLCDFMLKRWPKHFLDIREC